MPPTPDLLRGPRRDLRSLLAAVAPAPRGGAGVPTLPTGGPLHLPGRGTTFVRTLPGPGTGRGPAAVPIVLLHGWTLTADLNFHPVYDRLAARAPVIALDTRCHGRGVPADSFSYADAADDVVAVLDALGVERAVVSGFSLGGVTAILTALRHPDRVAGIVPQACALDYRRLPRDRAFRLALGVLGRHRALRHHPLTGGLSRRYWHDTARRHPQVRAQWDWVREELARTSPAAMIDTLRAVFELDLREEARRLRGLPSAYLLLSRDRICRPALQRATAAALDAPVVEIPADHNVPLSRPDAYAEALTRAIDLVLDQRPSAASA